MVVTIRGNKSKIESAKAEITSLLGERISLLELSEKNKEAPMAFVAEDEFVAIDWQAAARISVS